MKNFIKALSDFRDECDSVEKKSNNPFFKSKYADLNTVIETIKQPMKNNGLYYFQNIDSDKLITTIMHDSGEQLISAIDIKYGDTPQSQGSAITYARRYSLVTMLGLKAVDDDGNKGSAKDSSWKQTELLSDLLRTSTLSESEKIVIEREIDNLSADRATKAIEYLKENQPKTVDEEITARIEADDYYDLAH